jgi:hypothetical protein
MRKAPKESATKFSIGTKKKGNDNNIWMIVKIKNGVKRWQKKKKTKKTKKKKKTKKTKKTKKKLKNKENKITVEILKSLKKKYNVTTAGNKKEIAEGLWRVTGHAMNNRDLERIVPLLSRKYKKQAEKLLAERGTDPIVNYKGMWKPMPKPLGKMSRTELIKHLRGFRDIWERVTTRNMDLDDERLQEESNKNLRSLLKFYFSDSAKQMAGNWLRKTSTL